MGRGCGSHVASRKQLPGEGAVPEKQPERGEGVYAGHRGGLEGGEGGEGASEGRGGVAFLSWIPWGW